MASKTMVFKEGVEDSSKQQKKREVVGVATAKQKSKRIGICWTG